MTVYDKLLLLPFFQGIDRKELETLVSKVRFDFKKHEPGQQIAQENSRRTTLTLLMEGRMAAQAHSADRRYSVRERLEAPYAIEPERLFGLQQHTERSYEAVSDCSVLNLQKDDVLRLCAQSLVFEINILNALSTTAQRAKATIWRNPPTSIPQKIATFVANRSLHPAGEKTLYIRMVDLARAIGESRINVSRTLHTLQSQGLIAFCRQEIFIPHLEKLLRWEADAHK